MRRHSTITEKPHCHITYKLQDEHYANGWPEHGKLSIRGKKNKKVKNRENLDVRTMAASVLPATNIYNDYHIKYHSISAGSALSQSMKYAEAWLYGSVSVKPAIRPTFFNFEPNFQGQLSIFPSCCCSNHSCSNCGKTNTCNQCLVSMRNFNSVQAFGTVRAKNGVHFYHEDVPDPYDIVRQSRLAGVKKNATVRAKSHSPSKRKLIPLMAVNRLPSPEVVKTESKTNDEARRSILECDINPYDLVRNSENVGGEENSLLINDEDLIETVNGASSKKHKLTLKDKIISKLQDKGKSSLKSNKTCDTVDGVSIAGQKIRIFNTPTPASADGTDDWISDPSFDDEPEIETENVSDDRNVPQRPPRRKPAVRSSSKMYTSTPTDQARSSVIYQNSEIFAQNGANSDRGATTAKTASHYGDIKSILKKPPNSSTKGEGHTRESDKCSSPEVTSDGSASSSLLADANNQVVGDTCLARNHMGGGNNSNQNFYPTTFSDKHCASRKVKKQVQFKGMQEQTIEDESCRKPATFTNADTTVHYVRPADAVEEGSSITANETTKNTSAAAATPDAQLTQPLTNIRDVNLHFDPRSPDQEHHRVRSNASSSSLPLPSQSVVKPCVVVTSPSVLPVSNFVLSADLDFASDHSLNALQGRDVVASEPASRLHRTQSECTGPRPLLAQKHCETFKDTMRLRLRCNPQIEPKRLFCQQRNTPIDCKERLVKFRKVCSRPAIPPPLPPNLTPDKASRSAPPPQLPPRQCFPFDKSANARKIVDRRQASNEAASSISEKLLLDEKMRNAMTVGSVIKINVAPDTPPHQTLQSNHDNRTIVTITPDNESTRTDAVGNDVDSKSSNGSDNGNNRTSITINVNDRSPPSVCQSNCNTVTINVGYNDNDITHDNYIANSLISNSTTNNSVHKSNVRITPCNSNTVYVNSSQADLVVDNYQRKGPRQCTILTTSSQKGSGSTSGDSSSDLVAASAYSANDFSVHYMSCKINEKLTEDEVGLTKIVENDYDSVEPIYEEISDTPPPLPLEPPPERVDDIGIVIPPRSIFEGASKYDILKYLAGAKERCRIPEEPTPEFVIEEALDSENGDLLLPAEHSRINSSDLSSRLSHLSNVSDSSDELASFLICSGLSNAFPLEKAHRNCTDIERNDSGVGSETSKCSRSKWQHVQATSLQEDQQHICEDCEQPVEAQISDSGLAYAPLVCRKCSKKRIERREIIAEIVETEEKYGRDLRIILDEFYKPMLVAGLLSPDQLSSIFLNVEELLEHNTTLAEKLRDGYEIAIEQGDEDLLTFNIGKIFLDAAPMLHAFESYCTRQGNAALLLANLEKEKELLKIFLRVSQMENTVLRRMNLNSFLMVPVQRVTKYPLLLARLYKVTPEHHTIQRELLKEAQHNIELHLEHINSLTKDIGSMKIWRRISMMNGRRVSSDVDDIVNIKLQKIAVEVLEWGHEEVRFAVEGRLLYAQPTDYNWKRTGRTIKVIPVNALLVTLGKPTENYNPESEDRLTFPQKNGIREASLLLMKEKGGKYSLVRDPLYLDHCIIYCDSDCEEYFEVQEIPTKDTYIFKAEDEERTRQWYKQLQYHSQGLGCWRRRRNALANIMINGMQVRS